MFEATYIWGFDLIGFPDSSLIVALKSLDLSEYYTSRLIPVNSLIVCPIKIYRLYYYLNINWDFHPVWKFEVTLLCFKRLSQICAGKDLHLEGSSLLALL